MRPYFSTWGEEQTSSQKTALLIEYKAMAKVQKTSNRKRRHNSVYCQV